MLIRNLKRLVVSTPRFSFGGGHGHGHHEINRDKITLRNEASGTSEVIQVTIWTPARWPER